MDYSPQKVRLEQIILQNGLVEKPALRCIYTVNVLFSLVVQKHPTIFWGLGKRIAMFRWESGLGTSWICPNQPFYKTQPLQDDPLFGA